LSAAALAEHLVAPWGPKRRSNLNAIKHGILADIVIPGEPFRESIEAYNRLHEHFGEDIQPVGTVEEVEVEHLVFEYLRMTRFYRADVQVAPRVFKWIEDGLKEGDTTIFSFEDPKKAAVGVRKEFGSELLLRYGN
jgi:hypothetical protein